MRLSVEMKPIVSTDPTDAALVQSAKSGDRAAFAELFEGHRDMLVALGLWGGWPIRLLAAWALFPPYGVPRQHRHSIRYRLGAQRPLSRMDPSNASSIGSYAMQITFRLPFDQDVSKGAT